MVFANKIRNSVLIKLQFVCIQQTVNGKIKASLWVSLEMKVLCTLELDAEELPARLQKALEFSGLSVTALCDAIELSQRKTWYDWVNGKANIHLARLRQIERVTGYDLQIPSYQEWPEPEA